MLATLIYIYKEFQIYRPICVKEKRVSFSEKGDDIFLYDI